MERSQPRLRTASARSWSFPRPFLRGALRNRCAPPFDGSSKESSRWLLILQRSLQNGSCPPQARAARQTRTGVGSSNRRLCAVERSFAASLGRARREKPTWQPRLLFARLPDRLIGSARGRSVCRLDKCRRTYRLWLSWVFRRCRAGRGVPASPSPDSEPRQKRDEILLPTIQVKHT